MQFHQLLNHSHLMQVQTSPQLNHSTINTSIVSIAYQCWTRNCRCRWRTSACPQKGRRGPALPACRASGKWEGCHPEKGKEPPRSRCCRAPGTSGSEQSTWLQHCCFRRRLILRGTGMLPPIKSIWCSGIQGDKGIGNSRELKTNLQVISNNKKRENGLKSNQNRKFDHLSFHEEIL